jgi:hypothetical protein
MGEESVIASSLISPVIFLVETIEAVGAAEAADADEAGDADGLLAPQAATRRIARLAAMSMGRSAMVVFMSGRRGMPATVARSRLLIIVA